eukprot:gene3049-3330_t
MFQTRENAQVPGAQQLLLRAPFASLTFSLPARTVSFGPPLASLTASAQLPVHTFGAAQVEPATGFNYPDEFCVLTKKHCPHLAGVGVRAKRILGIKNINVYSVGLYVEGSAAKKALHKHKGKDADQLLANQKVFDELIDSHSFEKSLRLVISFGSLKRSQFVSALEERLKPALAKAAEPASTMQAFEGWFDNISFKKGTEVAFASHHKGQLVAKINGQQAMSKEEDVSMFTNDAPEPDHLHRSGFCPVMQHTRATLFDIYVGPDPVSVDAKKSFSSGLAALLNE